MPFTPFHMGPGILIKSLLRGSFSLIVFGWAQIVMDIQPLVALLTHSNHLHGFSHTYLGATLLAFFSGITSRYIILKAFKINRINDSIGVRLSWRVVLISAFIGCYSHILLDSIMHADVQPFAPISSNNSFLHFIGTTALHQFCIYSGMIGFGIYFTCTFFMKRKRDL